MSDKEYIDPRIIKTRKAILVAFSELIREKTFRKITIGDIAERAIVNRATFYAHFDNKEDLLNYGVRARFDEGLSDWLPEEPVFTEDNLRQLVAAIFNLIDSFLHSCPAPTPDLPPAVPLLETNLQPAIQKILNEWLSNSGFSDPIQNNVQSSILSWSIFGTALRWAEDSNPPPMEEIIEIMMKTLIAGINEPALA